MNRVRRVLIRMNRRAASTLTDRAKRYRANERDVRPGPPKQCGFCGRRKNVGVHHVSGDETDGEPENLMWCCKRCNAVIANLMKSAGIGRRTRQYNPRRGGPSMDDYAAAIKVMRGQFEGDVSKAIDTIRATSPERRSAYTSRTWKSRRALYGPSGRG